MSDLILKVRLEDKKLKFISDNGNIIPYKYDKNTGNIEFLENKYKTHIFTFLNDNNLLKWKYKNILENKII